MVTVAINQVLFHCILYNKLFFFFYNYFTSSLSHSQLLLYLMQNKKRFTSKVISNFFGISAGFKRERCLKVLDGDLIRKGQKFQTGHIFLPLLIVSMTSVCLV